MDFPMSGGYQSNYGESNVLWDFRQFYVRWVEKYILNFSQAHVTSNYPAMYSALKKWHSSIWGRSLKEFDKDKDKNTDETFAKLISEIDKVSNDEKYQKTYFGKDRNAVAVDKLDTAINDAVIYLVWLMKKHKLFGSDTINRGLS